MCGIYGFNWDDEALAGRMARSLAHRGSDQEGLFRGGGWSLGHKRLSIIDLSEQGRQPIANEDGTVQVVLNGEILNHAEIRADLVARGHVFAGRADSEVLAHGYEEYGLDLLSKLRGMFAFAVLDLRRNRLLLVRDRLGIKPLYYHDAGGRFLFASEIKALLECAHVPRQLNRQALYEYLGFEFVPAPETMFSGIHKLPAGHHLVLEKGAADVRPYWDLTFRDPSAPLPSEGEVIERIRGLLDECVKLWLVSDVPVAAFLSGGLDSSAIVAMMRRHLTGRFRTYAIGYPDPTFSELDYAKAVSDEFGTDHHVLMINDVTPEQIEQSLWHLDEPMTDLSSIPLMLLSREARKSVKVCMSGEGGDEVFCGYDRFKASRLDERIYRRLPGPLRRRVIEPLVLRLPDQPQKKGLVNVLKRFVEGARLPVEGRHLRWQYFLQPELAAVLFTPAFRAEVDLDPFARVRDYAERCAATDRLNCELYLDLRYEMPDGVLMKADKMSMASALEVRVPLLDHKLVEYMATVPGDWKLRGGQTKAIFRKALHGLLPESIIHRGKQGYSLPVKNLLRDQLRDYMVGLLRESPIIRENMETAVVERLIREHLAYRHNHNHILWGLMNTAIWHNRFFRA